MYCVRNTMPVNKRMRDLKCNPSAHSNALENGKIIRGLRMTVAIVTDIRELKYLQIQCFYKIYKITTFNTHQKQRIHNDTGPIEFERAASQTL